MRGFQLFIKRAFDLTLGILLMLFLIAIPVLIVIPIVIKLTSKGPAVFTQERVGKNGKVFKIYKFRTMLIPEQRFDKEGNPLDPKHSITKVGRFLRKTSLDELMQIFNVINGTMSFIGPRPTLPYQVERYNERQRKRLEMRPGVTGWAQVNGRNNLAWGEKIEFDIEYVESFSIWFDIKVLFKTVAVVFKKEGIEFTKDDAINAKTPAPAPEGEKETVNK